MRGQFPTPQRRNAQLTPNLELPNLLTWEFWALRIGCLLGVGRCGGWELTRARRGNHHARSIPNSATPQRPINAQPRTPKSLDLGVLGVAHWVFIGRWALRRMGIDPGTSR